MLKTMRDTMRKKPAKGADVTSVSGDPVGTVSSNPWTNEESAQQSESLSSQVSITSKASDVTATTKASSEDGPPKPASSSLKGPDTSNSTIETLDIPKQRRKKTITKTAPHTFELEDELKKPRAPPELPRKPDPTTNGATGPTPSLSRRSTVLAFSSINITADIHPIDPSSKLSQPKSGQIPNNPFTSLASHARQQSYSSTNGNRSISPPYHFLPSLKPLSDDFFNSKVIVITHGASLISSSLIRHLHSAGCRLIFGDPSPDKARKLISSLGPPDIVHFNKCEVGKYDDILNLFRLAVTMYGRVDHAIFGVGDDGAQAATVGTAETLLRVFDNNMTVKAMMDEVSIESDLDGLSLGDILSASLRFAKIAMPFLKKGLKNNWRSASGNNDMIEERADKSITFLTSSASWKPIHGLPIYQITQHAVLGLVRSMTETVDPLKDGIRVNAVMTNIMIPTIVASAGGRMSVQVPTDRPEDVSRVLLGVIGSAGEREHTGIMHGRMLYVVGDGAFDIQEGLDRNEAAWMGGFAKEALSRAHVTIGNGRDCQWMLLDGLDTPV